MERWSVCPWGRERARAAMPCGGYGAGGVFRGRSSMRDVRLGPAGCVCVCVCVDEFRRWGWVFWGSQRCRHPTVRRGDGLRLLFLWVLVVRLWWRWCERVWCVCVVNECACLCVCVFVYMVRRRFWAGPRSNKCKPPHCDPWWWCVGGGSVCECRVLAWGMRGGSALWRSVLDLCLRSGRLLSTGALFVHEWERGDAGSGDSGWASLVRQV